MVKVFTYDTPAGGRSPADIAEDAFAAYAGTDLVRDSVLTHGDYRVARRVAFTERRLPRPQVHEPLLDVLGDLDDCLDERGVLDGQPFLISPDGRYDVTLNRYFEQARMSAAPWNTQATHARDLKNFLDFLWGNRGGRSWREATAEDRAAYERWRRKVRRGRVWSTRPGTVRSRRSTSSSPGPSARAACTRARWFSE